MGIRLKACKYAVRPNNLNIGITVYNRSLESLESGHRLDPWQGKYSAVTAIRADLQAFIIPMTSYRALQRIYRH
jgi:hypothetical protein